MEKQDDDVKSPLQEEVNDCFSNFQRLNFGRREACKSKGSTIEMKKVAWEGRAIRAEAVKS